MRAIPRYSVRDLVPVLRPERRCGSPWETKPLRNRYFLYCPCCSYSTRRGPPDHFLTTRRFRKIEPKTIGLRRATNRAVSPLAGVRVSRSLLVPSLLIVKISESGCLRSARGLRTPWPQRQSGFLAEPSVGPYTISDAVRFRLNNPHGWSHRFALHTGLYRRVQMQSACRLGSTRDANRPRARGKSFPSPTVPPDNEQAIVIIAPHALLHVNDPAPDGEKLGAHS